MFRLVDLKQMSFLSVFCCFHLGSSFIPRLSFQLFLQPQAEDNERRLRYLFSLSIKRLSGELIVPDMTP